MKITLQFTVSSQNPNFPDFQKAITNVSREVILFKVNKTKIVHVESVFDVILKLFFNTNKYGVRNTYIKLRLLSDYFNRGNSV